MEVRSRHEAISDGSADSVNETTSGGSTDPVSVRIDVAMTTGGGGGGGAARLGGGAAAVGVIRGARGGAQQALVPRHQLTTTNREVITTRAIGPTFHC